MVKLDEGEALVQALKERYIKTHANSQLACSERWANRILAEVGLDQKTILRLVTVWYSTRFQQP